MVGRKKFVSINISITTFAAVVWWVSFGVQIFLLPSLSQLLRFPIAVYVWNILPQHQHTETISLTVNSCIAPTAERIVPCMRVALVIVCVLYKHCYTTEMMTVPTLVDICLFILCSISLGLYDG